jgi:hypothetical protein
VATFTDAVLAGDVRWEEILRKRADRGRAKLCLGPTRATTPEHGHAISEPQASKAQDLVLGVLAAPGPNTPGPALHQPLGKRRHQQRVALVLGWPNDGYAPTEGADDISRHWGTAIEPNVMMALIALVGYCDRADRIRRLHHGFHRMFMT